MNISAHAYKNITKLLFINHCRRGHVYEFSRGKKERINRKNNANNEQRKIRTKSNVTFMFFFFFFLKSLILYIAKKADIIIMIIKKGKIANWLTIVCFQP